MVHTSYLPDWRLPSSWWTILYIPAACQICANNVFGGILKVTEYIKEFDKSLFLDSVNSFLRFQPERIWKIMIFQRPRFPVRSCHIRLLHPSDIGICTSFLPKLRLWSKYFRPSPEGAVSVGQNSFCLTETQLALFVWTENPHEFGLPCGVSCVPWTD